LQRVDQVGGKGLTGADDAGIGANVSVCSAPADRGIEPVIVLVSVLSFWNDPEAVR